MSSSKIKRNRGRRVIIRGFRDSPAALVAVEVRGNVVDVVGTDPNSPMPFHLNRAFAFDESLYGELSKAHAEKNAMALAALWEKATQFLPDSKG